MGVFHVDCEIADICKPKKATKVDHVLVDTGSAYTWIKEVTLKEIGVQVAKKDLAFTMANGQTIRRKVGFIIISVGDFRTVDEVVFGQPGDLQLLGARTLAGFGAIVDSRKKRLVAAGPHPAA